MEDVLAEQQKLTRVAGVPIVSNVPVVPEV
jgi:hypothetical protein